MTRHRTVLRLVAVVLLISSPPLLPANASLAEMHRGYASFFRQLVSDRGYPGAAFVTVSRERILHLETIGHTTTQRGQEIDENTVFRLASVSKTFAAEAVGLLVQEGTLDWNEPLTRYLPGFRIDGDTSQIQIHHLLGQSTGLMPHAYDNLLEHGRELEFIWKKMADLTFICRPGTCYGYQNSVFSLVDPLVVSVTSSTYPAIVQQRIFKPLDMRTASLGYEAFIGNPNRAEPHARRNGRWQTVRVQPNYYRASAAAGINASILDMGKWLRAQLGSHPKVLPPELLETLQQPRVRTRRELYRKAWKDMLNDAHYGLGWRIYELADTRLVYHGGWVSGFRADVAFSPQHDLGIAVLLNAESSGISELTTRFWQMALTLDRSPDAGAVVAGDDETRNTGD